MVVLSFCGFMERDRGQYPANLTAGTGLVNKGFITLHSTPSCRLVFLLLCLPVFVAKCKILETHPHFCFLLFFPFLLMLSVLSFSSSILTEKSLFTVTENILRKKTLVSRLDLGEILKREQNRQFREGSIARVANQSTEFAASFQLAGLAL